MNQRTLKRVIEATGVTVHSGQRVAISLRPAPVNTGVVFERVDLPKPVDIPAAVEYINGTNLNTSLVKDGVKVATVEHMMSALAGLGIDNIRIQLNAPELPIMDGSAGPFVLLLQSAGIVEQQAKKRFIRIKKPISCVDGDKHVSLEPYNGFKVAFTLDYDHPVFQNSRQSVELDFAADCYVKEVSRARTFGFLADYEKMQNLNLAQGASLDNTVVLDNYRILNQEGLRYADEFAKHKILDAIGDLYLLGHNILGKFTGHKSGHGMNAMLIDKLMKTQSAWEYVTYGERQKAPVAFFRPAATPMPATS